MCLLHPLALIAAVRIGSRSSSLFSLKMIFAVVSRLVSGFKLRIGADKFNRLDAAPDSRGGNHIQAALGAYFFVATNLQMGLIVD